MGIKIKRKQLDQHRFHRITAPLFARLDGGTALVQGHDWSLGGSRVDRFPEPLTEAGREIKLHLSLPFQGSDISFEAKGLVVRAILELKSFAVDFTEMGERSLMQHFVEDLVRGVMAPIEEAIQRIAAPVTPVSTEPDAEPRPHAPPSRIPVPRWPGPASTQLEEAGQWLAAACAKLNSRKLDLKEQMRLADSGLGKYYFDGRDLVGGMAGLDAGIKLAHYQIALSHQAHEALLKQRERIAVRAPFDGRLVSLPNPESATVRRGDLLAVFEKNDDRWMTAYLTQDEVMKVASSRCCPCASPSAGSPCSRMRCRAAC